MILTPHFKASEFLCRHGLPKIGDPVWQNILQVAQALEEVRDEVQMPIRVISGYRCEVCNKQCGGARQSQHLVGRAADIVIKGFSIDEIAQVIWRLMGDARIPKGGVGLYYRGRPTQGCGFLHYDIRGYMVTWRQRR